MKQVKLQQRFIGIAIDLFDIDIRHPLLYPQNARGLAKRAFGTKNEEGFTVALRTRWLSAQIKVFLDEEPIDEEPRPEGFQNERIAFQLAFYTDIFTHIRLRVSSPIMPYILVRRTGAVPVMIACGPEEDDNVLRRSPGLYPDRLMNIHNGHFRCAQHCWESLWVEIFRAEGLEPGNFPVSIYLENADTGEQLATETIRITVHPGMLPPQRLIHTKWFHCDCLAEYYHTEVFSEDHWKIIENYIRFAVDHGINTILMPVHTPPLDTLPGTDRLTVQLVGVMRKNGKYSFDMSLVHRWISLCRACGVRYYEIAHLFTQWGAEHAPKIIGKADGTHCRLFGWETNAAGKEYREFLAAYIPALRSVFREEGIEQNTLWHISDEPNDDHLSSYLAARRQVDDLLDGCYIMDALSSFEFYRQGIVAHPVVATNHITPFLEARVPGLWAYYCSGQRQDVSNMFLSYPSARNRILGVQLFKFGIRGFLQWGYNFYHSCGSEYVIDPYSTTDGDGWVPAGDTFQVYPGQDGFPEESIRMAVTTLALQDLRALDWLADLIGREHAISLIEEGLSQGLTFSCYPTSPSWQLEVRQRVNLAIMNAIKKAV